MLNRLFCWLWAPLIVLSLADTAFADVRLPKIFGDGMVLQREKLIAVWGWADQGENLSISFADHTTMTTATGDGRWRTELPPLRVTLSDVVVSDVWLCSAQSNMSISVGHFSAALEVKQDLAAAKFPSIRHFGVQEHFANEI